MKSEDEIRKIRDLMIKTYEKGSEISPVEAPADAYNSAQTLSWVLGEESIIPELFAQSGLDIDKWLKENKT